MIATKEVAPEAEVASRDPGMVAVLVKAFNVLEVMAEIGEPAPLRQIAKATDLPKGTLFRILQTLMDLGYINQVEDSSFYYLTSQISYLGRNSRQEDIKLMALPLMKALHAKFNETVNLGVLEGVFVYYVLVLEAQRPLSWRVPAGTRDMFYSTALGRAIASQLGDEHREILIRRATLKSRTNKTVATKQNLAAILDTARRDGHAIDDEENDDGVVCIGVPLFLNDRVIASISLSIPSNRYTAALGREIIETLGEMELNFRTSRGTSSLNMAKPNQA